jgi:iron complex transport system permease protein
MKKLLISIILIVGIIISIYALRVGGVNFELKDILSAFGQEGEEYVKMIIFEIRLPRILMAILIGMMLASSGAVVQALFQNPLADPYIIGIAASATFGAVLAYVLKLPNYYYGLLAFISCLISSFLIFGLARSGRKVNVATLLIIGIAISSFLGAFTSFAMYYIGEDSFRIVMWTMGYLGNATWEKVGILTIPLFLSIIYFYKVRNELDALLNGDEEAHSLGVEVDKLKRNLLVVSSLVVAFSVAFSGMIGFIGLIVPHAFRMIVGGSNRNLIPIVTLAGGVFLLICDTIARTILAPMEIPIGIITAFLGAPFFLYLAFKAKKGGLL